MSTFIDTADNYQYMFRPLSHMRREKFKRIVARVGGGDVLDLGCGQAGHYWAMGYAHKADSLSFYDIVPENIAEQQASIETLSPDFLAESFGETLGFLGAEGIIPQPVDPQSIAENIVGKTVDVRVFNFIHDKADRQFDFVMAMESIEIADTYAEFVSSLRTAKSLLKPGGLFLGVILPYDVLLPTTQEQISIKREGILNPRVEETRQAFSDAGWNLEALETYKTLQANYDEAICFYARHA
ncbi:MAG: methyltransferase domain-containing protein [Verrucomicrobium sp.]|nr:methyltransferase domain-containing protein [Verrucomicrobium sp.]